MFRFNLSHKMKMIIPLLGFTYLYFAYSLLHFKEADFYRSILGDQFRGWISTEMFMYIF